VPSTLWEPLLLFGLGASALLLGETLRSEALVLAKVQHAELSRVKALRSFDAIDLQGRSFRVRGDSKRLLVFDDADRMEVWRPALEEAVALGVDAFVVCVNRVHECRRLTVPSRTRVIAYTEWKYLPSLAALHRHRGALAIDPLTGDEHWNEAPPIAAARASLWNRLLGRAE
jgi:hypothetical protein